MQEFGEGQRAEKAQRALPRKRTLQIGGDHIPLTRRQHHAGQPRQQRQRQKARRIQPRQAGRQPAEKARRSHQRNTHEQIIVQQPVPAETMQ